MKKFAGVATMSAFSVHSKKRKNKFETNGKIKKVKTKKKKVRLSDILPTNLKTLPVNEKSPNTSKKPLTVIKTARKKKKSIHAKKKIAATANGISLNGETVASPLTLKSLFKTPTKQKVSPTKLKDSQSQSNTSPTKKSNVSADGSSVKTVQPEENESFEISQKESKCEEETIDKSLVEKNSPQEDTEIPKCLDNDPMQEAKSLFKWLINPLSIDKFFENNWERAPLHIKRTKGSYYKFLMSTPGLDRILRECNVLYTKNIDITSYANGQRETHNPAGRALPSVVWDYYLNGCSVRMLNPQSFIPRLHALNATLQEFFGCFVGANSYLTPPDSQGFAPHYDDIEAFILQIEGKKRWRLYKPITDAEYLSRYSSRNFDPSEIGEPILDTVVNAGDLLYFPRGTIHQGETIDGSHSLHITLSVYQKNSWCDYLEKLIPEALKSAVASDSSFREGLPIHYLRHVGRVNSTDDSEVRQNFVDKTKELLHKLIDEHLDIDKAADQMAKSNVYDFLPPVLSPEELECSVLQDGERITTCNGVVENRIEIEPDTRIRLLRSHCIRLVEEDDGSLRIYYSTENSKEYHEYEPQFLEVTKELAPAIQEIVRCYPRFIRVDDLPIEGEDNKVQVARDLWEKCIVVTDSPLPIVE